MKRLDALTHNELGRQIARTRQVWQPRLGQDLADADARQILNDVTGFFGVLAEWSRANDTAAPATSTESEVRP